MDLILKSMDMLPREELQKFIVMSMPNNGLKHRLEQTQTILEQDAKLQEQDATIGMLFEQLNINNGSEYMDVQAQKMRIFTHGEEERHNDRKTKRENSRYFFRIHFFRSSESRPGYTTRFDGRGVFSLT